MSGAGSAGERAHRGSSAGEHPAVLAGPFSGASLKLALVAGAVRGAPWLCIPLVLVVAAWALSPALFAIGTSLVVGALPKAAQVAHSAHGGEAAAQGRILIGFVLAGVAFLGGQLLGPLQQFLVTTVGVRLDQSVRSGMLDAVLAPWTVAHLESPAIQDQVRLASAVGLSGDSSIGLSGATPSRAFSTLVYLATLRATGLATAIILLRFHVYVAALAVGAGVAAARLSVAAFQAEARAGLAAAEDTRRLDYLAGIGTSRESAYEVRLFGLSGWLAAEARGCWKRAVGMVRGARRRARPLMLADYAVFDGMEIAVLAYVAVAGATGHLSLGEVALYVQAIIVTMDSLGSSRNSAVLEEGSAATAAARQVTRRLRTLLPGVIAGSTARAGGLAAGVERSLDGDGLRLTNVSFTYPGASVEVLRDVSLYAGAGETIAIVGANGSGKTTIAKLLCGLYEPTCGSVTVGSAAVGGRRVAALFQDYVRYPLSLRENVAMGSPELRDDDEAIRRALRKAGGAEILAALPEGLATPLSPELSGGVDLSSGQWQRVALARALLAVEGGADVMILDEPTASLDVRMEAALYEQFVHLTSGVTTVLISHRFSTVRRAERIYVLERGRVVESGRHDELVAANRLYAAMFEVQAARYSL